MLPTSTFGNRFVIVKFPNTLVSEASYKIMYESATFPPATAVNWQHGSAATVPLLDDSNPITLTSSDSNYDAYELVAPAGTYASVTQFTSGRKHFCIRLYADILVLKASFNP